MCVPRSVVQKGNYFRNAVVVRNSFDVCKCGGTLVIDLDFKCVVQTRHVSSRSKVYFSADFANAVPMVRAERLISHRSRTSTNNPTRSRSRLLHNLPDDERCFDAVF